MKKISVIVPVYNVEKYLPKCIESILAQTYTEFELILVDDGSSDNSGNICDAYAVKDSRIRVVHQSNKGVSIARNMGLDMAQGDYIGFVDADDHITPNMYETMINYVENAGAQIAICVAEILSESGKFISYLTNNNIGVYTLNRYDALFIFPSNKIISYSMCDKLFCSSILKEIRCDPNINILEDCLFVCESLFKIKKCILISTPLYSIVERHSSALRNGFSEKRLQALDAMKKCLNLYKNMEPEIIDNMRNSYITQLIDMYIDATEAKLPQNEIDRISRELNEYNYNYKSNFINQIKFFMYFKARKFLILLRKIYRIIKNIFN